MKKRLKCPSVILIFLSSPHIMPCRYNAILLEFETYYAQTPQKPLWVKAYSEHITVLKTSKIVSDPEQQLNEQLRKYFGYRKTVKIVQVSQITTK